MEKEREPKEDRAKEIKEIIDKQIELEKLKNRKSPAWKIVLYIFCGIVVTGFFAFVCYMMYKQSFTMETLLTVLLSFFSIILSIMFYVQSEKSSSTYYMRSYDIMKEVSVALGKIESGFGEKLSMIQGGIKDIKMVEEKVKQGEIEENEIKKKIAQEKLSQDERSKLLEELQGRIIETAFLRKKLERLEKTKKEIDSKNLFLKEQIRHQRGSNGLYNYYIHEDKKDLTEN